MFACATVDVVESPTRREMGEVEREGLWLDLTSKQPQFKERKGMTGLRVSER